MNHEMRLNDEQFNDVKKGIKTVELRLYDMKRKAIKKGDTITFISRANGDKLDCLVQGISVYKNFEELFNDYTEEFFGRPICAKDMLEFYTEAEIEKYGCVAIEIKLK